ncbi:MAG: hypothetical protein JWO51_2198 [Rhodospirillales bacterium]|nr:hypothetical protein [Rhodospirillales bacterium]
MFDLLSAVALTASAVIVIVTLCLLFARTPVERAIGALVLALWFVAVVALGATGALNNEHGLGTPGLGLSVMLPLATLAMLGFGTGAGRARLEKASQPLLIGVHGVRVLGVCFVLLQAAHRLPAPFAPIAGWGDIAIGLTALPMLLWVARAGAAARAGLIVWELLGLLDLVAAIGLGATSSPGPIRLFFEEPGSAIMTSLPWILIPSFIVPILAFTHLVSLHRLFGAANPRAIGEQLAPEIGRASSTASLRKCRRS